MATKMIREDEATLLSGPHTVGMEYDAQETPMCSPPADRNAPSLCRSPSHHGPKAVATHVIPYSLYYRDGPYLACAECARRHNANRDHQED